MTVPFDPAAPLPGPGDLLSLEASAGTGKTWSVATLAARYIVEAGQPIDRVMVITFSRASTQELRDRVRGRLEECAAALAEPPDAANRALDPALAALVTADPATLALRRARADAALRDFDQAAVFTTHGFCDSMLRRLGVLVDHDPADRLSPDVAELTRQAADDLYLARFGLAGEPAFALATAERWAKDAMLRPALPLVEADDGAGAARFAAGVRARVDREKRRLRLYTYDDMLARLRDALADPVTGPAARARLAATYPVVLVDEFQDTDPVQWEILESAFLGRSALVVIGDPKQSIYGFRGADLPSYLRATAGGAQATLDVNRRSAPALVTAVAGLFDGLPLGDARITAGPVRTSAATPRLVGPVTPWAAPLRLRVAPGDEPLAAAQARELVDADLVADVGALLASGLELARPGQPPRPLGPNDVAIIVTTNARGQALLDRLAAAGLPAVFTGAQSVFASAAAADWLALLRAVAEPRTARVRAAALTHLLGWSLDDLVTATPDRLADLALTVRQAGLLLAQSGPAALFEHLADRRGLAARLAGRPGGGRLWTDLRQLADQLQRARRGRDAAGLLAWLDERHRAASAAADESTRRLETDAPAIRMLTVHQAKGLQFPVVYLPQAADRYPREPDPDQPFSFHDDAGRRWLDLGTGRGPERRDHLARYREDEDGEQLRVLYVALTRAACHVTAWWVPTKFNTAASALHRILGAERGQPVPAAVPVDGHSPVAQRLPDGVAVELMDPLDQREVAPVAVAAAGAAPALRTFDRTIDTMWQRTSYTALTAGADHGFLDDEPEPEAEAEDMGSAEAMGSGSVADGTLPLTALSPMSDLPAGAAFGSLVHAVFEYADPSDPAGIAQVAAPTVARSGLDLPVADLVAALQPGLATPLGPIADGRSLRDIGLADRLAELDFELPLAVTGRAPTLHEFAAVLARHLRPGDPLAAYPERLRDGVPDTVLHGFLTGSIDVVLRLRGAGPEAVRYVVVDYKTNRLAPPDEPATLALYTPARLAEAMMASHYPLQALLYSVALHRFLRWRQPGYDPARHLGGIAYLFVRGLAGPETPVVDGDPTGVFAWRPPAALIADLDALLAGRLP